MAETSRQKQDEIILAKEFWKHRCNFYFRFYLNLVIFHSHVYRANVPPDKPLEDPYLILHFCKFGKLYRVMVINRS